jgi:hypothetical protein
MCFRTESGNRRQGCPTRNTNGHDDRRAIDWILSGGTIAAVRLHGKVIWEANICQSRLARPDQSGEPGGLGPADSGQPQPLARRRTAHDNAAVSQGSRRAAAATLGRQDDVSGRTRPMFRPSANLYGSATKRPQPPRESAAVAELTK